MKGKIFLSFVLGMGLETALGAGVAIWFQHREPDKGITVERTKDGTVYQIQAP